mmetsp:Transcript_22458/g.77000  ORF Transcript_22458/g.77000 Transcript_22458/m.77000 type:complete len:253 (-) Transcript_22458:1085-1843(-)
MPNDLGGPFRPRRLAQARGRDRQDTDGQKGPKGKGEERPGQEQLEIRHGVVALQRGHDEGEIEGEEAEVLQYRLQRFRVVHLFNRDEAGHRGDGVPDLDDCHNRPPLLCERRGLQNSLPRFSSAGAANDQRRHKTEADDERRNDDCEEDGQHGLAVAQSAPSALAERRRPRVMPRGAEGTEGPLCVLDAEARAVRQNRIAEGLLVADARAGTVCCGAIRSVRALVNFIRIREEAVVPHLDRQRLQREELVPN